MIDNEVKKFSNSSHANILRYSAVSFFYSRNLNVDALKKKTRMFLVKKKENYKKEI